MSLADARLRIEEVDVLHAWGPGHRHIDAGECSAMREVFDYRLPGLAACSIKGAIGSPLGAAPAIQIAASALGLAAGVVPATVNWHRPDPDCPLSLSSSMRYLDHGVSLVNAHGVGGVNSSLVLKKC